MRAEKEQFLAAEIAIGDNEVKQWFVRSGYNPIPYWRMAEALGRPIAMFPELTEALEEERAEIVEELAGLYREANPKQARSKIVRLFSDAEKFAMSKEECVSRLEKIVMDELRRFFTL